MSEAYTLLNICLMIDTSVMNENKDMSEQRMKNEEAEPFRALYCQPVERNTTILKSQRLKHAGSILHNTCSLLHCFVVHVSH